MVIACLEVEFLGGGVYSLKRTLAIYDTLHNLVTFVQFKKREKHPWRSVTFSKVAGF